MQWFKLTCKSVNWQLSAPFRDAIALAQLGCSFGWAAQVFRRFAEHSQSSPLVSGGTVVVWPDELLLHFQMQQQVSFEVVPLDSGSCPASGPGVKCIPLEHVAACRSALMTGRFHEHGKLEEDVEILHGVQPVAN